MTSSNNRHLAKVFFEQTKFSTTHPAVIAVLKSKAFDLARTADSGSRMKLNTLVPDLIASVTKRVCDPAFAADRCAPLSLEVFLKRDGMTSALEITVNILFFSLRFNIATFTLPLDLCRGYATDDLVCYDYLCERLPRYPRIDIIKRPYHSVFEDDYTDVRNLFFCKLNVVNNKCHPFHSGNALEAILLNDPKKEDPQLISFVSTLATDSGDTIKMMLSPYKGCVTCYGMIHAEKTDDRPLALIGNYIIQPIDLAIKAIAELWSLVRLKKESQTAGVWVRPLDHYRVEYPDFSEGSESAQPVFWAWGSPEEEFEYRAVNSGDHQTKTQETPNIEITVSPPNFIETPPSFDHQAHEKFLAAEDSMALAIQKKRERANIDTELEKPIFQRDPTKNITKPCLSVSIDRVNVQTASFDEILAASRLVCRHVVDHDQYYGAEVQIIPYITFFSEGFSHVLTYQRGTASQSDLVEQHSVGFGGHIDQVVWDTELPEGERFATAVIKIYQEIERELLEELGFVTPQEIQEKLLADLTMGFKGKMTALTPQKTNNVSDSRHMGLVLTVQLPMDELLALEKSAGELGHVENIRVMDVKEVSDPEIRNSFFENWSRLVLIDAYTALTGGKKYTPDEVTDALSYERAVSDGLIPDTRELRLVQSSFDGVTSDDLFKPTVIADAKE